MDQHQVTEATTVVLYLIAIGFKIMAPRASEGLVNAALRGLANLAEVWRAWGRFVGVHVAFYGIRNLAIRVWNPLSARTMQETADEGFVRVQSFSSDWHGAIFAGATVRRSSRAMLGYDVVASALIMWIGQAVVVLVGLSLQMMLRWPIVGAFSLGMITLHITTNILISIFYVRAANRLSVALGSRIGGALTDSIRGLGRADLIRLLVAHPAR